MQRTTPSGAIVEDTTGALISAPPVQPVAAAPMSPTPLPTTPAAPTVPQAPSTTINVNAGATPEAKPAQAAAPTMPANGSVVDMLNAAGQDSSYANRQQLAQQYGIQGYTGTAAQNTDLSKKYLEAFNANKGLKVPDTGAQAASALDSYFKENNSQPQTDPVKSFMDSYASMNPIEANIFQQLSTLASTPQNQQSLTDFYKQEVAAQGVPELNMELADVKRIMDGTEDDIRDEIKNVGGLATESQVQALTGARNKALLKQASYLSDVLNAKNDYIDNIVSLTQADRKQVSDDLDRKLGITNTLVSMADKMTNNAKENYKMIVDSVGWEGLAKTLQDNPSQTAKVEKLFGLAPGELQALSTMKKPLTPAETLQIENLKLQNQKLKQDINAAPTISTQVVDVGGKKVLINSKTGATIAEIDPGTSSQSAQTMAISQQNIKDVDGLIKSPALGGAVGANPLGRIDVFSPFTGAKSNFIASVEQVRAQLTKDSLINAKAQGATFGALSEGELGLLQNSASKLGTWAVKDSAGNIVGYKANEKDFKAELDKINNFAKLDFLLKGGDPASVDVQEMPDGTLWTQNSDGTKTQLK